MISIGKVKNAKQAAHYFMQQDNYYFKDPNTQVKNLWYGKGAKALGLRGGKWTRRTSRHY